MRRSPQSSATPYRFRQIFVRGLSEFRICLDQPQQSTRLVRRQPIHQVMKLSCACPALTRSVGKQREAAGTHGDSTAVGPGQSYSGSGYLILKDLTDPPASTTP
ncbi:hypothetical protein GCM10027612_17900 [Microbispora bryophytorum subsp. camponoti]